MTTGVGANETPPPPPTAPVAVADTTARTPVRRNTARHWRVLRNALVSKTRDETSDATASSLSTEFFPQFSSHALSPTETPALQRAASDCFEWRAYAVTKGETCKRVLVHEKQKRQKVSLAELFSHKLNAGVDNTGNIRTWPSEQILLAYLLKKEICKSLAIGKSSPIACCELGSGMAGLASLGLAAHDGSSIATMLVTDGNPQSVENLEICIQENVSQGIVSASSVAAELLRWDRSAQFPPTRRHQFDLLFASDCLFFEDFHEDLAYTIRELLCPQTGVCYLLQPSRNGSMERFCAIASSHRHALQVRIVRDYDTEIACKHVELVATKHAEYVPDVHFPVLLELRHNLEAYENA